MEGRGLPGRARMRSPTWEALQSGDTCRTGSHDDAPGPGGEASANRRL